MLAVSVRLSRFSCVRIPMAPKMPSSTMLRISSFSSAGPTT